MGVVRIIGRSDLEKAVQLDLAAIDCVEHGFRALAEDEVVMPPILSLAIPAHNGEVDVKTAYVPGMDSFAIKVSPGFFDNPKIGLPSTSGLMMLFASKTGVLEAVLLDSGYLTDVRTAAAGAVAARQLSRENARTACVMGAGMQAKLQLKALCLVRPIETAHVWARNPEKAKAAAEEMSAFCGIPVHTVANAQEGVAAADIIVTTTPSTKPILRADWLRPGQHITAMGSDQEHKNEIEPACFAKADVYVADRVAQTARLGELRSAIETGVVSADATFAELGAVIVGAAEGRTSDDQITLCDLTGTGVQDTMIADLAFRRSTTLGLGSSFENQE